MTLRTPLCDLLGIEHPIVQSGMGGVAGPDLVAEVSKAGGLGIIAGLNLTPDQIRQLVMPMEEDLISTTSAPASACRRPPRVRRRCPISSTPPSR